MTVTDDKLLDGVEIYNAHPGHESNNEIAEAWAKKYSHLRVTSGSDYHGKLNVHPGGLFFPERPACPHCLESCSETADTGCARTKLLNKTHISKHCPAFVRQCFLFYFLAASRSVLPLWNSEN